MFVKGVSWEHLELGQRTRTSRRIAPGSEINAFQIDGNGEATRQTPTFGRGRLDHFAFRAASLDDFDQLRDRLVARGAATAS